MISVRTPNSRSNSHSKNNSHCKNRSITIISSSENIDTDKDKNNDDIIHPENNRKTYLTKNKNTNIGRTYITNFNIRDNNTYSKTEANINDNKIIKRNNKDNQKTYISNTNTSNRNDKNYKYISKDVKQNFNNYNQNQNNNKNQASNNNNQNNNNVFISSYTTKRVKDYKNEDKNKTNDLKNNKDVHYNSKTNNQENKTNNEIKIIKDVKTQKEKPVSNIGSNIGFLSSNSIKNKSEPNKEKKNEPIVHNTQVYITKRKTSHNNITENQTKPLINKENKIANVNENNNQRNIVRNIEPTKIEIKKEIKYEIKYEIENKDKKENKKENLNENDKEKNINKVEEKKDIVIENKNDNILNENNDNNIDVDKIIENIETKINEEKDKEKEKIDIDNKNNDLIQDKIGNELNEKEEELYKNPEIKKEENENKEINLDYINNYTSPLTTDYLLKDSLNLNLGAFDSFANSYEKYDFLTNPGLSDSTKIYLTSHTSNERPELNDYTKAYLDALEDTTNETSPELSNLTKEYLSQNVDFDDRKNEEDNKNEN